MKIIIGTSLCVLLDLIIKMLINAYFFDCNINLIGEVVTFTPVLNRSISYFALIFWLSGILSISKNLQLQAF